MVKTADDLYQMSRRWFSFLPLEIITSKEHHRPRHYLSQMDSSQPISAPSVRREPRYAEMAGPTIVLSLARTVDAFGFQAKRDSGSREKTDQSAGGVGLRRLRAARRSKTDVRLVFARKRSQNLGAVSRHDFAEQRQDHRRLAGRHALGR